MGSNYTWSKQEIEYLEKSWGIKTLSQISKSLNRSKTGVFIKAKRLKLGASTRADEYITARQVAEMLGISDSNIVLRWIKKNNLPAKKRAMLFKKQFWMIHYLDLLEWLEQNQERFDSRKIMPYALGCEPKWLSEKRARDQKLLPKNRFKKWSNIDTKTLICLKQKGYKIKELAKMFCRSSNSIERRLNRALNSVGGIH